MYIYNYLTYRAVGKRAKILALVFLWGSMLISILILSSWPLRVMLLVIGAGASTYILSLKTLTEEVISDPINQDKNCQI